MNITTIESNDQIVFNTLYNQRLYYNQLDPDNLLPENEYLTKLIQLNFMSLTDRSCLLSGFELYASITKPNIINIIMTPGMAIVDHILVELNQNIELQQDLSIKSNLVLIGCKIENNKIEFTTFAGYMNKQNQITLNNLDLDKYTIVNLIKITQRDNDFVLYSSNRFTLDNPTPDLFYYNDLEGRYPIFNLPENELINKIKNITPIHSYPNKYNINGIDIKIPNYPRQVNNAYWLSKLFRIKEYNIPVPHLEPHIEYIKYI